MKKIETKKRRNEKKKITVLKIEAEQQYSESLCSDEVTKKRA